MKITCGGESIETNCSGCMCHEMAMVFGDDPDHCAECGCPKTPEGFRQVVAAREVLSDGS